MKLDTFYFMEASTSAALSRIMELSQFHMAECAVILQREAGGFRAACMDSTLKVVDDIFV